MRTIIFNPDTGYENEVMQMDEKKTVTQVIESVCEEMCNDFCKYSMKGAEPTDDGTCGHFEDCPLNKLQ